MRLPLSILAVLLSAGCFQAPASPEGAVPTAAVGPSTLAETPAPLPAAPSSGKVELAILDAAGLDRLIASHRGKVVVVDAWSTSCEPCLEEFPNLVALSKEIGPERLACISLSLDYDGLGQPEDKRAKVLRFLERFGATFDNVLSSDEADAVFQRLDFFAPPAVFVYDREGKLSQQFDSNWPGGHFTYADVRKRVDELLAAP